MSSQHPTNWVHLLEEKSVKDVGVTKKEAWIKVVQITLGNVNAKRDTVDIDVDTEYAMRMGQSKHV